MNLELGETVKNFVLKDQDSEEFNLYAVKGKKILLSFHPLAWTNICAQQMRSLEDHYEQFSELNVLPVGISVDTIPSKKAWAEELGINKTRLLSDFWPHGELAKSLGIFLENKGVSMRVNIVLDKSYNVIYKKIYEISEVPDFESLVEHIQNIKGLE